MAVLPTPVQSSAIAGKDGTPSTHAYRWMDSVGTEINNLSSSNAGKASITQTETISATIPFPDDFTYRLIVNAPAGFTINSITTQANSGTCTATFSIDGVALGGGANSVSTTEQTKTHTSANVVAVGQNLTLVVSANSGCEGMVFTINATRTLAP